MKSQCIVIKIQVGFVVELDELILKIKQSKEELPWQFWKNKSKEDLFPQYEDLRAIRQDQ